MISTVAFLDLDGALYWEAQRNPGEMSGPRRATK
jgi:hypothetical protein